MRTHNEQLIERSVINPFGCSPAAESSLATLYFVTFVVYARGRGFNEAVGGIPLWIQY